MINNKKLEQNLKNHNFIPDSNLNLNHHLAA